MHVARSRYAHLAGFLGALALLGCGGGGRSRGAGAGDAYAHLQWSIYDVGGTAALSCSAVGASTVNVYLKTSGFEDSYNFACADGYDSTAALPPGTYSITVTLYGDSKIYGDSTTVLEQVVATQDLYAGDNPLPTINLFVNSFVLGWSITSGGVPTTCAWAGAAWVALDIYYPGESQPGTYYLPCDDRLDYRTATTAIATYDFGKNIQWQAFLLDANDKELSSGTRMMSYNISSTVQADLGSVVFPF